MYLLDTNACIRILNGTSESLINHMRHRTPNELRLCSIVKAELSYGAQHSGRPAQNLRLLEQFFQPFLSFPFDDRSADVYGRIRNELEGSGTPIGPNDLLIAATAIAHSAVLITHNTREFSRVIGLHYEDWEMLI